MLREGLAARWPWQWALKHVCSVYQVSFQVSCTVGGLLGCPRRAQVCLGAAGLAEVGGQCSLDGPPGVGMREGPGQGCPLSRELS